MPWLRVASHLAKASLRALPLPSRRGELTEMEAPWRGRSLGKNRTEGSMNNLDEKEKRKDYFISLNQ